ncbi:MAG: helix-turn-helix domain-containing protein [Candidatus Binataceae bacterium]
MKAAAPSPVMTVKECAEFLHIHPVTLYKLVRQRGIPFFKVGSDYRFNREQIGRWTQERTSTPPPHTTALAKFWQASTSYKLDDRAAIRVDGKVLILVCIRPGKSALTMPDIPQHDENKIWDGLCVWKIEN